MSADSKNVNLFVCNVRVCEPARPWQDVSRGRAPEPQSWHLIRVIRAIRAHQPKLAEEFRACEDLDT